MRKKSIITVAVVTLLAIITVLAITTTHHTTQPMPTAATVMTNQVSIKDYMFSPMASTVKVGTKVTWTNTDSVSHTITADNASSAAPSSMDIAHGKSYSFTFTKAGTYTYHCFPHPYMHGTITVTE